MLSRQLDTRIWSSRKKEGEFYLESQNQCNYLDNPCGQWVKERAGPTLKGQAEKDQWRKTTGSVRGTNQLTAVVWRRKKRSVSRTSIMAVSSKGGYEQSNLHCIDQDRSN
jgi:hypothetical protein